MDKFRNWLDMVDVPTVAQKLGVTTSILYLWKQGKRYPSRESATALIELSHGLLNYNDIMQTRSVQCSKNTKSKTGQ